MKEPVRKRFLVDVEYRASTIKTFCVESVDEFSAADLALRMAEAAAWPKESDSMKLFGVMHVEAEGDEKCDR